MAKDPAVLFYTSDFLTGTMFFTDAEVGQYVRLLCAQHQKGHLSPSDVLNVCKSFDSKVLSKFIQDTDGNYYNKRMEVETNRRNSYCNSRRSNRLLKTKKGKKSKNICKSYVKHMETENETETITNNKIKYLEFVFFKKEEYEKLSKLFPDIQNRIERLNNYIGSTGKKYKSHYHTILSWAEKDKKENKATEKITPSGGIKPKEGKYKAYDAHTL